MALAVMRRPPVLPGGGPGGEVVTSRGLHRAGCSPGGGALKCWGRGRGGAASLCSGTMARRRSQRGRVAFPAPPAPAASSLVI